MKENLNSYYLSNKVKAFFLVFVRENKEVPRRKISVFYKK